MSETAFRVSVLVVLSVQSTFSVICTRSALSSSHLIRRREEGVLLSLLLVSLYMAYCCGIIAYLIEPQWMTWGSLTGLPMWARWIGLGPFALGAILIVLGLTSLGTNFVFSVSPQEGSQLVLVGVYRWMRHPLYTAFLIEAVGISLMITNWFVGMMALLTWGLLACRTRLEEEQLIERFGDEYREYMARTGRFLPRIGFPITTSPANRRK